MTTVSLVINGQSVQADVAPRTSLVDFLREHQALTATHVCGTFSTRNPTRFGRP
jgi:carbon-monoxide dehydrogenase small subunit